uniref:Uncharacterized protein n=1 Tax=Anguilla anguilla TaxID=7936 RepID=A0A0E9QQX1_ANGAN
MDTGLILHASLR